MLVKPSFAQMGGMMGNYQGQNPPSQSDIQKEQNEQNEGQAIYQKLQDKRITCKDLTNDDLEKLGDYFMWQALGSTENHFYMDQRMTQMMGDQANTQVHIAWGQRGSGCSANTPLSSNTLPSQMNVNGTTGLPMMGMMGYSMMADNNGLGIFSLILLLTALADLILLGALLFKKVRK